MAQRNTSRKPRSSGASRRGGSRKGGGVPGWVWLVTGVLTGLFVAFLVILARFDSSTQSPSADKGKDSQKAAAQKEPPKHRAPKESPASGTRSGDTSADNKAPESAKEKVAAAAAKPDTGTKKGEVQKEKPAINYDFYKILPQYEVVVPEDEARNPANTTANSPGTYYLQVGAFRQMPEADSRKAGLAMLGIVASIQTVTIDPGNTWHRVRIGPVKDMRQLDRTKRQLQENNIAFVTLKEKS